MVGTVQMVNLGVRLLADLSLPITHIGVDRQLWAKRRRVQGKKTYNLNYEVIKGDLIKTSP